MASLSTCHQGMLSWMAILLHRVKCNGQQVTYDKTDLIPSKYAGYVGFAASPVNVATNRHITDDVNHGVHRQENNNTSV